MRPDLVPLSTHVHETSHLELMRATFWGLFRGTDLADLVDNTNQLSTDVVLVLSLHHSQLNITSFIIIHYS